MRCLSAEEGKSYPNSCPLSRVLLIGRLLTRIFEIHFGTIRIYSQPIELTTIGTERCLVYLDRHQLAPGSSAREESKLSNSL